MIVINSGEIYKAISTGNEQAAIELLKFGIRGNGWMITEAQHRMIDNDKAAGEYVAIVKAGRTHAIYRCKSIDVLKVGRERGGEYARYSFHVEADRDFDHLVGGDAPAVWKRGELNPVKILSGFESQDHLVDKVRIFDLKGLIESVDMRVTGNTIALDASDGAFVLDSFSFDQIKIKWVRNK